MKVVKISPGKNAQYYWSDCRENEHICVGWREIGNLRRFDSFEELWDAVKNDQYRGTRGPVQATAEQLWIVKNLESGDEVIANKGMDTIVGVGKVAEPYRWNANHHYPHTVAIDWDTSYEERTIPVQEEWRNRTVAVIDSPGLCTGY